VVGATVTAQAGTWGPGTPTLSYQWTLDGDPIEGATTSSYRIVGTDRTSSLAVRVAANRTAFTTLTNTSAPSIVGSGVFSNTAAPTVTGFYVVGGLLTATPGTWTPSASTVTYQWLRGSAAISGATTSTYTLVAADKGKRVSVRVTVTRDYYLTASQSTNGRLVK
jgi:hypothetical protein